MKNADAHKPLGYVDGEHPQKALDRQVAGE